MNLSRLPSLGFSTAPLPGDDGYDWTLTTLLGEFISNLESAHGPRDYTYTVLGIEFCGDRPQVWYPGNRKHISIMLTDDARLNPEQAIFQLAHEAVHLLSPSGGQNANVAEEGLAALFSERVSLQYQHNWKSASEAYRHCAEQVERWLSLYPDAIKHVRTIEPSFSDWTPALIVQVCPETPADLAARLCEKFGVVENRLTP